ncbi:MAG TPA: cysteine desulfurase family protein, partial [Thermoplasmata archaeon]
MKPIYLDYNASTPVDPEVIEEMAPYLRDRFGNPSSGHLYGRQAKKGIEEARGQMAELINGKASEIVFTSGGTESNNIALCGAAFANRKKGRRIVTSVTEHPAVLNPCRWLQTQGFDVKYVDVDQFGLVDLEQLERLVDNSTILVSVMHANNETGTVQPISEIAKISHRRGALFHTDAAQTIGKLRVDVKRMGIDLLSVAGHKFYAPKGIGALFVRDGTDIEPFMRGAGHEHGLRPGTENTASIVGLGKAADIAMRTMIDYVPRMQSLRDLLHRQLLKNMAGIRLNGHPMKRLPNTLNVSVPGIDSEALLASTPELAASTGSACHANRREPSPVLTAM